MNIVLAIAAAVDSCSCPSYVLIVDGVCSYLSTQLACVKNHRSVEDVMKIIIFPYYICSLLYHTQTNSPALTIISKSWNFFSSVDITVK